MSLSVLLTSEKILLNVESLNDARRLPADFFSILLAPIAQLEHKDRPCQQQRDGIGQDDRPGMEDQSIQKPKAHAG